MSLEENAVPDSSTDSNKPAEQADAVQESASSPPVAEPDTQLASAPVVEPEAKTEEAKTSLQPETAIVDSSSNDSTAANSDVVESPAESTSRVKLNPAGADAAKAVPSLASAMTEEELQQKQKQFEAGEKMVSAEQVPSAEPVNIPAAEQLDTNLEAELEAALKGSPSKAETAQGDVSSEANSASSLVTPKDDEELEPGLQLKGKVDAVEEENIVVDIGFRMSGILNKRDMKEDQIPAVGNTIDVIVVSIDKAEGLVQLGSLQTVHRAGGDWNAIAVGQVVECTVEKTNKGGLSVLVSQLRGFMPAGQVDLNFVGDLEPFVGQKLTAKVIDVNPKKKNLVISRRAILQEERDKNAAAVWEELTVGEQRTGKVKTIKDYGAFVDIGGVDGLLHVRELSWTRIKHPSDILKQGQEVEVKILTIDNEKKKISLGMKQLLANPWDYAEQKYPKNTVIKGLVKKTTEFGAFVEIEEGLEGLVHVSELDFRRVNKVTDVLKEGQEVEAQVLEINKNKQRISLSVKALKPKPQASPEQIAQRKADAADEKQRREAAEKRRLTLRGGNSSDKGGGLFGNPGDFS